MHRSIEELALKSLNDWWADAGVIGDFQPNLRRAKTVKAPAINPQKNTTSPRVLRVDPVVEATKLAKSANSIDELQTAIQRFEGCDLKTSARSTVIYDGSISAKIMIIGDPPRQEEDAAGKPFAGKSGKLLDAMLASIGLSRQQSIYATTVIPWRTPGNRAPEPAEIAICRPFLQRQIELIQPKLLIAAGKISAQALLNSQESIMRMRGRKLSYRQMGFEDTIPCIPIFHPEHLLKRPAEKAKTWRDVLIIKKTIDELGL